MYLVFYANKLVGQYESYNELTNELRNNDELRNGVYIKAVPPTWSIWYRGDFTPCFSRDVPKETRALALLF